MENQKLKIKKQNDKSKFKIKGQEMAAKSHEEKLDAD